MLVFSSAETDNAITDITYTPISLVTDGGCFACHYNFTDELQTQTDTDN